MKIIVISDTHVPERIRSLPKRLIKRIQPGDIVFHCGDFTSYQTYEILRSMGEFHGVHGNMDDHPLNCELPDTKIVQINNRKIGMTHGWGPPSGLARRVYDSFRDKPDVILFGHSHSRTNEILGNTLMFNPGAVASGWGSSPSYGELMFDGNGGIIGRHFDL
jgi:putative phosphoesterase